MKKKLILKKYTTGGFVNPYKHGDKYKDSEECAYFSNHTLNDQGYMMSGNAWTPRGADIIFNGFEGKTKPENFDENSYNQYLTSAVKNVYDNFNTRDTLNPNQVYTVNMFYAPSTNKEKAFNEGNNVYGTHTGYLSYDKNDDNWYVTHNIHGTVHKQRFGSLQNPKGNIGVTAIYQPRKETFFNRVKTKLGFKQGGILTPKYQLGGPINAANSRPHSKQGESVIVTGVKNAFNWLNEQPIIKKVAHAINEHGKQTSDAPFSTGTLMVINDNARIAWYQGDRLGSTYQEHYDKYFDKFMEKRKQNRPTNNEMAARQSVAGATVSLIKHPYARIAGTVMSAPDVVYDWAASIDEPNNTANHAHTATNHLESLAKITPTKYDDIVAKTGNIIGNIDDVASGFGINLFK